MSLTVTVPALGVALAAPFAGLLADRVGRRPVIVWSAFLLAAAALGTSFATTLTELIICRFWQGIFTPGVFAVTVAYINDEWRDAGAGQTVAAYISGTVSGGFSSRFLAGLVAAHAAWPRVFAVSGGLNLALAAVVWAWLPEETHPDAQSGGRKHQIQAGAWSTVKAHLRNRPLLGTFLVGFCMLFSIVATFTYITFHLAAPPFNLQPAALGSIFFVYLVGAAVTPLAGRAIDRFGHRVTLASAIAVAAIGVALTLGSHLWIIGMGLAVCCTGVFIGQASASGFVGIAATENRALAVGLYSTFYYVGGSAGATIPGFFYSWGEWPACAAFIVSVQAITILVALLFWKPGIRADHVGDVRGISV